MRTESEDRFYIDACIVVEGKDDTIAIRRAVEADTIETNGSAVGEEVLERIKLAHERRGIIIFTDPDAPGDRIRRIVSEAVPGCKHAFLPKNEAISKNGDDLGIENASPKAIRKALESARQEQAPLPEEDSISKQDLMDVGLLAGTGSRKRREELGKRLGIGYANGKQLLKRLSVFRIHRSEFIEAISAVIEEERER